MNMKIQIQRTGKQKEKLVDKRRQIGKHIK